MPRKDWLVIVLVLILSGLCNGQVQNYTLRELPPEIGLRDNSVNDILQDHQGFLWLATWSGLLRYDGYEVISYRQGPENENGLRGNKITCLFEDSRKTLWVGTNYTGFYRYNVNSGTFTQYKRDVSDMNSLSNDNVWTITEDDDGYLWIGTESGLNRFDPNTEKFVHFKRDDHDDGHLTDDFITSLSNVNGDLWVGCEIGLNRMVRDEEGSPHFFINYSLAPDTVQNEDFFRHNFIYKIVPSRVEENTFWVGTSIGLKKVWFDDKDMSKVDFLTIYHDEVNGTGLSHRFVSDILEDQEAKQLWIATYSGIDLLSLEQPFVPASVTSTGLSSNLSNNVVKDLYRDKTGVLWIGTDKGTNYVNLDGKPIRSIFPADAQDVSGNVVSCIRYDPVASGFWIGTKGGGVKFWKGGPDVNPSEILRLELNTPELADFTGFISDIQISGSSELWIATEGAGIFRMPSNTLETGTADQGDFKQYTKESILSDDYVMAMCPSGEDDMWIGYWDKGIDLYLGKEDTLIHFQTTSDFEVDLQHFPVVHFMEIGTGDVVDLWIGTRGGGVFKMNADKSNGVLLLQEKFTTASSAPTQISNDFVNCFMIDEFNDQNLWIGTENGLNRLNINTGEFSHILEADGLSNAVVQSIAQSEEGLWLSTKAGISRVTFDQGAIQIGNYENFDGRYYNFYFDDAVGKSADGSILFGGTRGIDFFHPSEIESDPHAPEVVITDFRLNNEGVPIGEMTSGRVLLEKDVSQTSMINLRHDDDVISIQFVGLHLASPEKLQYAYKLDGFNEDWIYAEANERVAHYTNLPHSRYEFMVKAANEDGLWSEPKVLSIDIHPPFWLTGWAYLLYVLVGAGLVYALWRIVQLRAEYKHEIELERIEREKLEEVNQLKLKFFTNVSHELRTPLTLIISPLEDLIRLKPGDRKVNQTLNRMYRNANRLLNMINQLLDIRKSDAGQLRLKVERANIVNFLAEIVRSFDGVAARRGIEITFDANISEDCFWFDSSQLEKVVMNLMSNAVKFTDEKGEINVTVSETSKKEDGIIIEFSDNGIGIPSDAQPYIFNRFYQVDVGEERSPQNGTGIGLALCKSLVEAHHGRIWLESQIGEGSSFYVFLRHGNEHFDHDQVVVHEEQVQPVQNALDTVEDIGVETSVLLDDSEGDNVPPSKPTILVVEDNSDIREYLAEHLEEWYQVEQANNGKVGLERALDNPPELIIADISMPEMDGIELCRRVKESVLTSHVPVLLLTARTSLVYKLEGYDIGADDYVTKPFNMELLVSRVRNLIQTRKVLREKFGQSYDLSPKDVVLSSPDEELLKRLRETIEQNIEDSDFSVEKLALRLGMSRMQLYRKLKALTGKTPVKIIQRYRMQRAAQLLKTRQYNVSDVTYMVGYNDLKSFRDQFKKEFGTNPSEFANSAITTES